MGKNTFLFATLLSLLFIYSPAAQDATDSASNYIAGASTALDDTNGFQTENIIVQPNPAVGGLTIEDAVAAGGSAVMNDSSGNAMVMRITNPTFSTGPFFNIEVPRTLDSPTSVGGTQVKFRAQYLFNSTFTTRLLDDASNAIVQMDRSSVGWQIRGNGVTEVSTIPATIPVDFLFTIDFIAQTFDVRLRRLDTNADEVFTNIPFYDTSANLARVNFQASFFAIGLPGQDTTVIINDIAVDSTGSLPAEIISLSLE